MTQKKYTKQSKRTKRTTETPLPEGEIDRAAARAGVFPSVIGPETAPVLALTYLKDRIVHATDLVSESIASIEDQNNRCSFDPDGLRDNLRDVLLALWRIRWECFAPGGAVTMARSTGGES